MEESTRQAKGPILPTYAENFIVRNIVDVDPGVNSFDFIFFDLFNVHPEDLQATLNKS